MNNEKILNLTDVDDDDFESIKTAIEEWKDCGCGGKFGFVSEEEAQECLEAVKRAFQQVYNKGVWRGGLAALGGIGVGVIIYHGIEYAKSKKKKED